jgi:hypothetical protein
MRTGAQQVIAGLALLAAYGDGEVNMSYARTLYAGPQAEEADQPDDNDDEAEEADQPDDDDDEAGEDGPYADMVSAEDKQMLQSLGWFFDSHLGRWGWS